MPINVKVQDWPGGRRFNVAIRLLTERDVIPGYYQHDSDKLTEAGRAVIRAVDDVPGVDYLSVDVYDFLVRPAVAFDAEQVYGQVLEVLRAAVAELGETLEVSTLPPVTPGGAGLEVTA